MLKEYPEYKETEAEWYGKIPKEWKTEKIKYLFSERIDKNHPNEPCLVSSQHMGVVPKTVYGQRTVEVMKDLHLLKLVEIGDFVISLRSFQGGLEYAYYRGIISPAYTILKNNGKISSEYFKYLAKSSNFIDLLKTCVTGIREGQNIDYSVLKNQFLPIPPIDEQNAIVKYLDYKTKQIDEFVSAKEKEIESLQELKKSLVADAVTKGISGEELVDSGIEWLPKVPKGWTVHTLRHLLKAFSEKNHSEMQLLSVTRELGVIVRDVEDTESNHNFIPDDLSNYKMVKKGQFVINKMKAWQGSYGVSDFDGIVSPAYFIFDLDFENKEFFHLAIRSRKYADFFARYSDGIRIGQWDLSMLDMKNIPFFVPPIEEQEKIIKYCKDKVRNIDTLITSIQKQVTLVKELRTKLIADAVTGNIDVRDVEIPA